VAEARKIRVVAFSDAHAVKLKKLVEQFESLCRANGLVVVVQTERIEPRRGRATV
jgi:hypothetical protein